MTKIRLAQRKDVPEMLDIYAPFILNTVTSFELNVPSEEEFWQRIVHKLEQYPWLVCEIDGKIAAYAYAGEHRARAAYQWNAELSVYVGEGYKKRGIASAMYRCLVEIVELQGYCNILAGISLPNPASVRFHEQFGFNLVGIYHKIGYKFGKWVDVGWWEMPLSRMGKTPPKIQHYQEFTTKITAILKREAEQIKH